MAVKKTYRINLRNYGSPPAVMVSQYDEGYAIAFEIFDGPLPVLASSLSGYTFKLKGRQPGNPPFLAYEFEGTLATALNAVVSFEIDTTMTGRAGKGTAELVILDEENDVKFASVNFAVYTEPAAVPDGSIDADVERAQEIAEEVQEIVDTAAAEVKGEAEAWAVGQRDGEDVPSTDPAYENNAKFYAEQAQDIADSIGIDATLSVAGKAADAKKTGDEISSLKEDLNRTEDEIIRTVGVIEELECGLTEEVKTALLACFTRVAWIGDDGQTYYDALSDALNRSRVISSISAVFTQGSTTIYDTDELYVLKQYLTVTATYSDGTTKEVNNYTLSGKLVAGTSTITVAYNKKTTTFNVTVTHQTKTLESISATFNSSASITTDNVLDDLRPYLTVLATYADSTTSTITNYSLSGNLNVGTNTITVSYGGKTTTFTVNVTQAEATLQSISAVFNQGSVVIYENSSLESLKPYLTVTARYSDGTTQTITNYTLSGTLTEGTSVITVSYSGKTTTFNVTVSERPTLQSIVATFTQGSAIIYENSSLNDLKPYLTVTARYSDSTTQTVTDYSLSGTLTAGTSTITVSYGGKTTTFNVTVSEASADPIYALANATTFNGTSDYIDTGLQLLTANKTNLTIVFDGFSTSLGGSQATLLHCMHETKPWPGLAMYTNSRALNADLNYSSGSAGRIAIPNIVSSDVSEARIKCVWIINFTSMKSLVFLSVNNTLFNDQTNIISTMSDVNIAENALIGCYQKTDGTKGRFWKGTMYDYKIYNYAWSNNAANAYLQEDHS